MTSVIREFIEQGATEKELEAAKNSILNSDIFNYAESHQIVVQQAMLEYHGFPPDQLAKRVEAIRAVTLEDVKAAAEQYLHPDNLIFIVVGNDTLFDKPLTTFGEVTKVEIE
jgi:zinc protease